MLLRRRLSACTKANASAADHDRHGAIAMLAIENDSHYSAGMLADPNPPKPPAASPALSQSAGQGSGQGVGQTRRIDSAALLGPRGEVLIAHGQQVYRLRVTSLGKLILTK